MKQKNDFSKVNDKGLVEAIRKMLREELNAAMNGKRDPKTSDFLTHEEAMRYLKVSYATLYNYRVNGIIKGVKVRQKYYYKRSDLDALLEGKSRKRY